ncbi:hypothetical protein HY546_02240 [archaeon]|nr:hypothetical protein [archaeon]
MPKMALLQTEKELLRVLVDSGYIGNHQALEENLHKFFPRHERGIAKDALESLKRRGFLTWKHKHYGVHVSINPQKIPEVKEFLKG